MSHQFIQYGKTFVPELVNEYKKRNPEIPLTLGIGHMFYHHDTFPPELSDQSIPLSQRQELTKKFMRDRVREVLEIVAPLMIKYPDLTLEFNLGNEVVWYYNGNFGWEGEYSDFPLYDNLGKRWIIEAYKQFNEVREDFGLPPERFIVLWNETHLQLGRRDPKTEYFISQFNWVSEALTNQNPQIQIGIQLGLGKDGGADVPLTLNLLTTPEGREEIRNNLNRLSMETNGRKIYVTEHVADTPEVTEELLKALFEKGPAVKMVNFWNALNRGYQGNFIVNKNNYSRLSPYYQLIHYLIEETSSVLPKSN